MAAVAGAGSQVGDGQLAGGQPRSGQPHRRAGTRDGFTSWRWLILIVAGVYFLIPLYAAIRFAGLGSFSSVEHQSGFTAALGLSVRLAVSLHAPDDELRDELVPVNRRWKVAEVLDAAWAYAAATGRRVSIEYALIRDINDQAWRAEALADLLAGHLAHVNLIPLNPTPGSKWTASDPDVMREFEERLARLGIPVTVRDTRGTEIDGACGQLAARSASVAGNPG